mgnify:CR=1 FL=1
MRRRHSVQSYEITAGRNSNKEKLHLDLSVISGDKDVSSRHARIFYNFNTTRRAATATHPKIRSVRRSYGRLRASYGRTKGSSANLDRFFSHISVLLFHLALALVYDCMRWACTRVYR